MKKVLLFALCLTLFTACLPAAVAETTREPLALTVTTLNWKYDDAAESPAGQAWLAAMEEYLGRKLDITWNLIPSSDYNEKSALMVNTNSLTDVMTLKNIQPFPQQLITLGEMGMFADFSQFEMPNVEALYAGSGDAAAAHFAEDGSYYYVCQFQDNSLYGRANMSWGSAIAQDVLDANNLEVPITTQDLIETAKALKEIYPDSYPVIDGYGFQYSWSGLGATFCTNFDTFFTTDEMQYVYGPATENYRRLMAFLNECYENELMPLDYAAWTNEMCVASVMNNRSFIFFGCTGSLFDQVTEWNASHDWTILSASLHDEEIGKSWAFANHLTDTRYSIGTWAVLGVDANAKNLADVMEFVDANYDRSVNDILTWGIEGVSYYVDEDGSRKYYDEYAQAIGDTIETNPLIALGCSYCNARSPGLWPHIQYTGHQAANWREYKIMNPDGASVTMNIKQYAAENISPENCNEVRQTLPTLSADDQELYGEKMAAVKTYAEECRAKFITGEMDIDADWDGYLETLYSMGDLQGALALYNVMLEGMELSW